MEERSRPHYKRKDPVFTYAMIGIYATTMIFAGLLLLDGANSVPEKTYPTPEIGHGSFDKPEFYKPQVNPIEIIQGIRVDNRDGGFLRSRVVFGPSK